MTSCDGNVSNDPFAAISTLPEVLDTLQVHLASERAHGVVEALDAQGG